MFKDSSRKGGVCVQCWTNGGVTCGERCAPGVCYSSGNSCQVEEELKEEKAKVRKAQW